MDRVIVYPAAIPQDLDILSLQRNIQITFGHLAIALLGSSTLCDGLACTPTTPASMSVQVAGGTIFQLAEIDQTAFGSLAPNTATTLMIGCIDTTTTFPITAPAVSGQTINYLIEATGLSQDDMPVVLPYYNAANPSVAFNGPNNSAVAQNTRRRQTVELQLKAGTAAAAGTQKTPAVDAGWVGLWVVTVNYGQTSITSASITPYTPSSFISTKLGGITGGGSGGVTALSQLSDVADLSPTTGQALMFNGTKWANRALTHSDISDWASATSGLGGGGSGSYSGLSDVSLTSLTTGQFPEWNGSRWVNHTLTHADISDWANATSNFGTASTGNGGYSNILTFTSNGSWQVPAGVNKIRVVVIGGGGGAGGSSTSQPGGGGGGGGYAESILQVTPGTNCTITIGVGGPGGPVGGGSGTNGGSTSFSTGSATVTASGGSGGNYTGANYSYGGDPGVGTSGQLLLPGGFGGDGAAGPAGSIVNVNPYGGGTVWAGAQHAAAISSGTGTGDPGQVPGGGGGGIYYFAGAGGPGANGMVAVFY